MSENRIEKTFERLSKEDETALIIFLTVGFPSVQATLELVPALEEAGADIVELGVPFSDPLAEGLTIQTSSWHSIKQGVAMENCIEVVTALRKNKPDLPLVLMGYYNPILAYGLSGFVKDSSAAGVDGAIVVDLPTEESEALRSACTLKDIHLIPLLAPTSSDQRIQEACEKASGFIYCVSVTGVTGARNEVSDRARNLVNRATRFTSVPRVVGFGISTREHVVSVGAYAQGVVVGSALIRLIQEVPSKDMVPKAKEFVARLKGKLTDS